MAPISQADVIVNKLNLVLSRSQQLTSSWLPASIDTRPAAEKDEEVARIFTAEPESFGLGYKPSKTACNNAEKEAQDELRKQLLGKRKRRDLPSAIRSHLGSKPRPENPARKHEPQTQSDEDVEDGRTSLGKRHYRKRHNDQDKQSELDRRDVSAVQETSSDSFSLELPAKTNSSRPRSFLDEALSKNAQKKRKKRQRDKQKKQGTGSLQAQSE